MLTGYRWEYILHGIGVVDLTFMGVGQVLPFVYKTCVEGEGGVECSISFIFLLFLAVTFITVYL